MRRRGSCQLLRRRRARGWRWGKAHWPGRWRRRTAAARLLPRERRRRGSCHLLRRRRGWRGSRATRASRAQRHAEDRDTLQPLEPPTISRPRRGTWNLRTLSLHNLTAAPWNLEPRSPRRGGRNLEPRHGFKKEIGAPMARPLDLEPGTYRNLLAEGSRNQNRGTPQGVEHYES